MKFDGYRTQVAISGSEVVVYTRNGHDWTRQFKVILPPLRALTKGAALIDGEIVAIDSEGRTNFSILKTGIAAGLPLKFYAFDLLELDGDDLSSRPLLERKERLAALLGERDSEDSLQFSATSPTMADKSSTPCAPVAMRVSSPSERTVAMSATAPPAGPRSSARSDRSSWWAAIVRATLAKVWHR
jgi:ATP-dependent DNA ligase